MCSRMTKLGAVLIRGYSTSARYEGVASQTSVESGGSYRHRGTMRRSKYLIFDSPCFQLASNDLYR
jgi:hypothetical protein